MSDPSDAIWSTLFAAATAARERAYAPYSKFCVGAAALMEDGSVVAGCNVESASFGLTVCAERHVVAQGVLAGQPHLRALVVVADSAVPVSPCGACRQVLAELSPPALEIRSRNLSGAEARFRLDELLPHAFTADALKRGG